MPLNDHAELLNARDAEIQNNVHWVLALMTCLDTCNMMRCHDAIKENLVACLLHASMQHAGKKKLQQTKISRSG